MKNPNSSEVAGLEVTANPLSLIPVTTYENGVSPKCTTSIPASVEAINIFGAAYFELKKSCDSLALYKEGQSSWFAATIGHEGMCLVHASSKAPDWW